MNIFYTDFCPTIAAQSLCDKHVVKMILESAQILCTVQHLWGNKAWYKPTHQNHPCVKWAASNINNYEWLLEHAKALSVEYTYRYGKVHKSNFVINDSPSWGDWTEHTEPPQCMPEIYWRKHTVDAYRAYYHGAKAYMAKWNKTRPAPDWWDPSIFNRLNSDISLGRVEPTQLEFLF